MPTYNFKRIGGEVYQDFVHFSELDTYCRDNKVEQMLSTPLIVSGIDKKPDRGFRDVLNRIKKANIRSNVDDF